MIKLINAQINNKYIIERVDKNYFFSNRLTDMGFTKNTPIFVCAISPFKGAILVSIRGVKIALREDTAKAIIVSAQ